MIDFTLTPSQRQLQKDARAFAQTVLAGASSTYAALPDQKSRFQATRPLYAQAVAAGQLKAQIPIPLGGTNASLVDAAIALEEMYAVDPSVTLTVAGTGLGLTPVILGGSPEQQQRLLKPFLTGEGEPLASFVHSEPGGTANWLEKGAKGLQTTARKEGDVWVINGEKLWTTNSGGWDGKGADLQCVVCRHTQDGLPQAADADPAASILILIVTREIIAQNDPGAYAILEDPELAGHVAVSGPRSRFTNLRVPAENLLAAPGTGAALVEETFGASAALVGAFSTSIMRATFEAALKFAREETRGGTVPILHRQTVADLLIDIKMRTDTSRLLTWKALHALQHGPGDFPSRLELCLQAKIFCSENSVRCVTDAMKVVGITSYRKDQPFTRLLNDAVCLPIFDGGNQGIRRRQIEKIFQVDDYDPLGSF
ncbi:hypothetical protein VTN77DRAFT_711 [Rasamsonia byssochlamydoides]|uniref:uncharacterized protein n=1 Tax=Rasamsonia byssochlamydoides TaxID=89139 RepID=UPI00374476FB